MPSFGSLLPADVFRAVAKKTMWWHPRPPSPRPARVLLTRDAEAWKFQTAPAPAPEKKKIGFGSGSGSGFDSSTQFILYTNKYGWKRKDEGLVHVVSVFA